MSKYILEFKETGAVSVNTALIIKKWSEGFSISTWVNYDTGEMEYTLYVEKPITSKDRCKARISKVDAELIISTLGLKHIKSTLFNSGGIYYSNVQIKDIIRKLENKVTEHEEILMFCKSEINNYKKHL